MITSYFGKIFLIVSLTLTLIYGQELDPELDPELEQNVNNILNKYSELLKQNHNQLESDMESENNKLCNFYSACPSSYTNAIYPITNLTVDPDFYNISINNNEFLVKIPFGMTETLSGFVEICLIENQLYIWKQNFDSEITSNNDSLIWQHYAGASDIFIIYPAFSWSNLNSCPISSINDYKPSRRPYYNSGTGGQKNLIILVDLSDPMSDRGLDPNRRSDSYFRIMINTIISLLKTLNHRDFVNIITYSDFSNSYENTLIRANIKNVDNLINYLSDLQIINASGANIGSAVREAMLMLQVSIDEDETSNCHNTMIIFSNGKYDYPTDNPTKIKTTNDIIIFVNMYSTSNDNQTNNQTDNQTINQNDNAMITLGQLTCKYNGVFRQVSYPYDQDDSDTIIDIYNDYLSSGTFNDVPKYSEPYDDALIDKRLITGSLPVYEQYGNIRSVKGVVSIDISIDIFNQYMNETDLLNYLIQNQECDDLLISRKAVEEMRDEYKCSMFSTNEKEKEPAAIRNFGWIVFATVIGCIFLAYFPCIMIKKNHDYIETVLILSFTILALSIWSLSVLYATDLYDDIVDVHHMKPVSLYTMDTNNNSYRCSEIINCQCTNLHLGPSCSNMKLNLEEGPCQTGYKCCKKDTYREYYYDYEGNRRYRTKTRCVKDVNFRKCYNKVGKCYNAAVDFSYKDDSGITQISKLIKKCGLDDSKCVKDFFDKYLPIGTKTAGYYSPSNKNEIKDDIGYNSGLLFLFVFPLIIIGLIIIGSWCFVFEPYNYINISTGVKINPM